jgi:hypothetical protein
VSQVLTDYYRVPPESLPAFTFGGSDSGDMGFFRFGDGNVCFGRCAAGVTARVADSGKYDALKEVRHDRLGLYFPCDVNEVVENLRRERYRQRSIGRFQSLAVSVPVREFYYAIRKFLPFRIRRQLQRLYFRGWNELPFPAWPVDFTVDAIHEELLGTVLHASGTHKIPFIWFWPDGASSSLIMTHDVETEAGRDFTPTLMETDRRYGIKASYQVVPELRYAVSDEYLCEIRKGGCEVNVHDLNHDGHLYKDRVEFARRATKINQYARRYKAAGFRAGAMYRKQEWYDAFEFSYDMSVPNVGHLEPFRGGCCTVMPHFIGAIVELPLTTIEDYSLFHILNNYSIDLWKHQLALIRARNGLMSVLVHPDYLLEARALGVYELLLGHLSEIVRHEKVWAALPGEVDQWWRARSGSSLVPRGEEWEIVGPAKDRARVAYAFLRDGELVYELADQAARQTSLPIGPACGSV